MMGVLVTGADGFVGRSIVAALARAGREVIASDLTLDTLAEDARVERIEAPIGALSQSLEGRAIDLAIHAAALTAPPESLGLTAAEHIAANLRMTLHMLDLCSALRVPRLIAISSAGVFSHDHPGPIDEAALPDALTPYGAAKRAGEIAMAAAASASLATLTVRFGNLYGPGERPRRTRPRVSLLQMMVEMAEQDDALAMPAPDALRDWTFVPDAAARLAELAACPDWPALLLHVCAPGAVTDRDLAAQICALSGRGRIEPAGAAAPRIRPPCTSLYQSWWRERRWTSLDKGLRAVIATQAS